MHFTRSDSTQRLGRRFIFAAWFLALLLLYGLFDGWLATTGNPNLVLTNRGSSAHPLVQLKQTPHGHYVARGAINGIPVIFLLDTGATQVSIPGRLADKLQLRAGTAQRAQTAAGTVTTYSTRLDQVELGPIGLRNVNAHINPHMPGEQVLLGMSFLRHFDFSQEGKILTIKPRAS